MDWMSRVDPKNIKRINGIPYPTWKVILPIAHEEGLISLSVRLTQEPSEANGWTAISEATAIFPGKDGRDRVFVEIGDASPKSTSPMISPHIIRMSATRAKGRALRDALGIGDALIEEMGADNDREDDTPATHGRDNGAPPRAEQPRGRPADALGSTSSPGVEAEGMVGEQPARADTDAPACAICGAGMTKGQVMISTKRFGRQLCTTHQRDATIAHNPAV